MDALISRYQSWAEQQGLASTTRYARGRCLHRLAESLPVPLIRATPEMLLEWRAGMQTRLCHQSIANYVTDVRQFYSWAVEMRLRKDNPAVRLPVPRRSRRLPRPISTDHLVTAIRNAPPDMRLILVLAAFCGLRAKEIALLRRECVLDTAAVPAVLVAADATKGDYEHMIPLSPMVLDELNAAGLPARGWIIARLDGQRGPNTPHRISQRARLYLRECGIPATLHQLRHWFGTSAYEVDYDLLAVAELMGHKDLSSTRIYAKVSQARKVRIVESLPVTAELLRAA